MIGMKYQDSIQRLHQHRIRFELFTRRCQHHPHKVLDVIQLVFWIHERHACTVFVAHGDNRRHFGDESDGAYIPILFGMDVHRIMVKRGQCANHAYHNRHRVGITPEAPKKIIDLVMHHSMHGDAMFKFYQFAIIRQFAF